MCGKSREDRVGDRFGVAPILENVMETWLRRFEHVDSRLCSKERRSKGGLSKHLRQLGRGRPTKTLRKTITKDLEINEFDI